MKAPTSQVPRHARGSSRCRATAATLCAIALAAAPGTAGAAQSPSTAGYSETGPSTLPSTSAGTPQYKATKGATEAPSGKTLPFTGADIGLAVLGGVILLSLGLVLRRTTRSTR